MCQYMHINCLQCTEHGPAQVLWRAWHLWLVGKAHIIDSHITPVCKSQFSIYMTEKLIKTIRMMSLILSYIYAKFTIPLIIYGDTRTLGLLHFCVSLRNCDWTINVNTSIDRLRTLGFEEIPRSLLPDYNRLFIIKLYRCPCFHSSHFKCQYRTKQSETW